MFALAGPTTLSDVGDAWANDKRAKRWFSLNAGSSLRGAAT
jgi:hypothetical protein